MPKTRRRIGGCDWTSGGAYSFLWQQERSHQVTAKAGQTITVEITNVTGPTNAANAYVLDTDKKKGVVVEKIEGSGKVSTQVIANGTYTVAVANTFLPPLAIGRSATYTRWSGPGAAPHRHIPVTGG